MIQSLKFSTRFYILDFLNVFRLWHPTVFKSKYQMLVNLNRGHLGYSLVTNMYILRQELIRIEFLLY